jgi:hypothetical protein
VAVRRATTSSATCPPFKAASSTRSWQALKDASKTGASGLGALSEKEGERLASSVAALSPNMSPDEYEKSRSAKSRSTPRPCAAIRDGKDPSDPAVAKQIDQEATRISALISAAPPAAQTRHRSSTPVEASAEAAGVTNLSDDQKHAYDAFLAANPNPSGWIGRYNTFLAS